MKSKQTKNRATAKSPSASVNLSKMLRTARRTSAYAFVAGLGVWLPKAQAATLVNLDATTHPLGALNVWTNTGSLTGDFVVGAGATATPTNVVVDGVQGISFLADGGLAGAGSHYVGPVAPSSIAGAGPRTIEAWIFNDSPQDAEAIVGWGRRGGDGLNSYLGHGRHTAWGGAEMWGAPDLGWGDTAAAVATNVVFGRWTHIVQTFDGTLNSLYVDGRLANSEGPPATALINTAEQDTGGNPIAIRVAREIDAAGGVSAASVGNFVAGRIRIHDTALSAAAVASQFNTEKGDFNLNDTDGDQMPDWWEARYGLNKNDPADAVLDLGDTDGLNNLAEYQNGTNPNDADSDDDGVSDGAEVNRIDPQTTQPASTSPTDTDSDDDGLSDGVETDTGTFVSAANTGTDPLKGDTDGDIASDGAEIACGTDPTSALSSCGLARAVELDATALATGPLTNWVNTGFIAGNFAVPTNATVPSVITLDGVNGVQLQGAGGADTGTHYVGPGTTPEVTGSHPRTVEAWVYDTLPQDEKIIIAWGKRAGASPDGANFPLGIGMHNTWGAVAAWGTPDIGWNDTEVHGRWTHLAATWDGTTTRLYSEGVLVNIETPNPTINTAHLSTGATPLPFRIGRQNNEAGGIDATGQGTVTIGKVRVYTNTLDAATIKARFDAERAAFGLADPDNDGLPSWYEIRSGLNPNDGTGDNGANGNPDNDGLTNAQEFARGTNATDADSDDDGANDGAEVNRVDPQTTQPAPTNPLNPDSDGDLLKDGVETDTGIYAGPNNTGTDPLDNDSDNDTFFDGIEINQGSNPNLASSVPSTDPIIQLIATNLPAGPLTNWVNSGTFSNGFAFVSANATVPNVQSVQGVNAVRFPGPAAGNPFYTGPTNPAAAGVTGNPTYSIEAWIHSESPGVDEEIILAWGRRGGPAGLNAAFGYGNSQAFGAMGHWDAPDLGWNSPTNTAAVVYDRWTHLVYTYNANTFTQVGYINGVQVNSEILGAALAIAAEGTTGPAPFRVGAQNLQGGGVSGTGRANGVSIGELRVYTYNLNAGDVLTKFNVGVNLYGISDPDGDGIPSWWERRYPAFMNETNPGDAAGDQDGDTLSNGLEYSNNTDPTNPDTDGDGVSDGVEVANNTNPNNPDTDLDGLTDGREAALTTAASGLGAGDTDADGFSDSHEVLYGSSPTDFSSLPDTSTPRPFVTLDATSLPLGPVPVWTNNNSLGWKFTAPTNVVPSVAVVDGTKGIQFFGTNHYVGPNMPSFFGGAAPHTVEAWIFNPALANEECIISWGRRGGPDGTLATFMHGASTAFGAVGYWGVPDLPWGTSASQVATNTAVGRWTHVAYTFGNDGVNETRACYKDGVFAFSESTTNLNILNTHLYDPTDPLNAPPNNFGRSLPIRVAAQSSAGGVADFASPTTMTIARIRAYDVALSAAQIAANYNAERVQFPGQPRITNVRVQPNGAVLFDWVPAPGRTYEVQRNDSVTNANGWSVLANGQNSGSFTDNNPGESPKYYRLRLE